MFNFVADRVLQGQAYPALATLSAEPATPAWSQFDHHWPRTIPVNLHSHCVTHGFAHSVTTVSSRPSQISYYTISPGFFDHAVDYIGLLSRSVYTAVNRSQLRLLFYYEEGDDPAAIKTRLDHLCDLHKLGQLSYRFISGNTSADQWRNFYYFPGHELLYWQRNQSQPAMTIPLGARPYEFTLLSRAHKWWRATMVSDLRSRGLLDHSLWSYNTQCDIADPRENNPIETCAVLDLHIDRFLALGPYRCDTLTAAQHNDHAVVAPELIQHSYCSIVLETLFDAGGSGGAFVTEKTFKCLKHGHPFVVAGCAGTVQLLRDLGYRTFDHCVDHSYDLIDNNTDRWLALAREIQRLRSQDMQHWFEQCRADLLHNQQVFLASKYNRLNSLYERLHNE